jgi:diguanylate cyclase
LSLLAEEPKPLLEASARPLLRLAHLLTGLETTFVTAIDWGAQTQQVLYALNAGEMVLPEGAVVDWHDSMCRALFLSGKTHSVAVGHDLAATPGARALGFRSFCAVPILQGDTAIGTVCGASRGEVSLDAMQLEGMRLIADALRQLLEAERLAERARARAEVAEQETLAARLEAQRHAEQSVQMEQLANTDVLTGLPNRRAFMARWEDELARSGRRNYSIALILIDADRFKSVNDGRGHELGDAVLRAIGATLLVVAKSPDMVARLGGDEFAIVTTHADRPRLLRLAQEIPQLFGSMAAELGVDTTLSMGLVSSDDCLRDRMLSDADRALYRSKAAGGDAIRLFDCRDTPPPP